MQLPGESIDWTTCEVVERVPGKLSGVPVLKHSRVPADAVFLNHQSGLTPEEISYQFTLPLAQVNAVLAFADKLEVSLAP